MSEQQAQQRAMGCNAILDQLPGYVLGAIDLADHELIESHLRTCDRCRSEAARLSAVTSLFPLALPVDKTPGTDSWTAIIERIDAEGDVGVELAAGVPSRVSPGVSAAGVAPPAPVWTRFLPAALIAPLAIALVVVSTWAASLRDDLDDGGASTITVIPQMLNDSNVRTYAVERSCDDCRGTGQLGLSNTSQLGVMVARDFDPGEDHMVWGLSSRGETIKVCELYVDPSGTVMQTFMLPDDSATLLEIYITDKSGALIYVAHLQPVTSVTPTVPVTIN